MHAARTRYGAADVRKGLPVAGIRHGDGVDAQAGRAVETELHGIPGEGRDARGDIGEARGEVHILIHGVVAVIAIAKVVTAHGVGRPLGLGAGGRVELEP